MTLMGYDPGRLSLLWARATDVAAALRGVRSDDPDAGGAIVAATAARANLEDGLLTMVERITASDPMSSWSLGGAGTVPVAWREWPDDLCDELAGAVACEGAGRAVGAVDTMWDVGSTIVACRDGGDDCGQALVELTYEAVAGTVLTPVGTELSKFLIGAVARAVDGAMEQSPSIEPDWSGAGGAPGVPPHDSGGGPVPEQRAPNGSNASGNLDYGGPDCAGLALAGCEHPECD